MDVRRVMRYVVTLVVLAWCNGVWATDLLNLKDTLTVLPEALRDLSLLHGAVAWHSGAIMNMYDYGVPQDEFLDPSEGALESPIIKNIVRKLFYRVPGTMSRTDFKVARREQVLFNNDKEKYIKNIAIHVVKLLYRYHIESRIAHNNALVTLYYANVKNILSLPQNQQQDVFFGSSQDQVYAEIIIRLAHLWALIGHDRSLIKNYYNYLKVAVNSLCENIKAPLTTVFSKNKAMVSANLLSWEGEIIFFDDKPFESRMSVDSSLLAGPEEIVCSLLRKVLEPVSYSSVMHKDNDHLVYANCMDTVIRNIINYITFGNDKKFNVAVVEGILGVGHQVHESLRQFYELYNSPSSHLYYSAHGAWGDVISNLYFVEYAQAPGSLKQDKSTKGFIKLPPGAAAIPFERNGFTVVTPGVECFEVRTTAHNFIVILNHLLQLHLFKNDSDLASQYFKSNFIENYLPKVFEKMGEIQFLINNNQDLEFSITFNEVFMKNLGHGNQTVHIRLQIRRHGVFDVESITQGDNFNDLLQNQKNSLPCLLFAIPIDQWGLFDNNFTLYLWAHFGSLDSVNRFIKQDHLYQKGLKAQEYTLLKKMVNLHADENVRLQSVGILEFLRLLGAQKIVDALELAQGMVWSNNFYKREAGVNLLKALIKQHHVLLMIFDLVQVMVSHIDSDIQNIGIGLFLALIRQGQAFVEALNAVDNGMFAEQRVGDGLFRVLLLPFVHKIKAGQAYGEAINAAQAMISSWDSNVQSAGIELFMELINQGQAFADALSAAQTMMGNWDSDVQEVGLDFLKEISKALTEKINEGNYFTEALSAAHVMVVDELADVRQEGILVFLALIKQGKYYSEVLDGASAMLAHRDSKVQKSGVNLFALLLENYELKAKVVERIQKVIKVCTDNRIKSSLQKLLSKK